jgi:coenzyme F420 hydrogenase subunit beta
MKLAGKLKQKLWRREWTETDLDKYVGTRRETYFTYATDPALRERAASGGSVTALLLHLVNSGQADGALVCSTEIEDGKPRPAFFIARTRDELIRAQGSKYTAVHFTTHALPLIKAFEGKLAVVALPCDATLLQTYRQKHPDVDEKIVCVFTLFCGHNSEPALVDKITDRLGKGQPLTDYTYRFGHWRGELRAHFADGSEVVKSFKYFSDYQNLYFFSQTKCHHCFDHFGYHADISAGDIWSPEMKQHPIKHTALIVRTERGAALVQEALAAGVLEGNTVPLETVANGQSRTAPFHYNVSSRAWVGRLFGLRIKDHVGERVRWNDYLVALMALGNERFSRTRLGRRLIWLTPRPLLKLYLYVFKGLESL